MAGEELQDSWRRTERHLRDALTIQELPGDMRQMAFDFIEHNEFGVAFEYVTNALVEVGARLTPAAHDALAAAAHEMGLEDNPDWVLYRVEAEALAPPGRLGLSALSR